MYLFVGFGIYPFLVGMLLDSIDVSNNQFTNTVAMTFISIVPIVFHAVIFAFI